MLAHEISELGGSGEDHYRRREEELDEEGGGREAEIMPFSCAFLFRSVDKRLTNFLELVVHRGGGRSSNGPLACCAPARSQSIKIAIVAEVSRMVIVQLLSSFVKRDCMNPTSLRPLPNSASYS